MDKWNIAQEKELLFWKNKWDFPVAYREKYKYFLPIIENLDKNKFVLDIGCGAYTVSGLFGFKNLWLIDSLINEYKKLENNNIDKSLVRFSYSAEEILNLFEDKMFNIVFFLNCADHINPNNLEFIFKELRRTLSGLLFFYSDFRNTEKECDECHPFIFTKQDFEKLTTEFDKLICIEKQTKENLNAVWSVLI